MAVEKPQEAAAQPVRLVTISEVRELLEREQGSRAELSYEQNLALEHAKLFTKIDPKRSDELAQRLLKLGGRMTEYFAYRLADIMPTHADDVRAVFARDRSVPDEAEINKILDTVREFA
ncbi:MAG: DNA-directed polymerase subunit [Thermoplasmata archaeon]|jgi:DNA-directed RNA polymerase subunit F|nr:DNA-directed polymerase subunit [Thermoplasmata archaeon]